RASVLALLLGISSVCSIIVQDAANWNAAHYWGGGIGACAKILTAPNGEIFCGAKDGSIRKFPSITSSENDAVLVW
ncbi:hypothetical protein BVRB_037580, partial [Beta vulgaris subsp. vulgaris]